MDSIQSRAATLAERLAASLSSSSSSSEKKENSSAFSGSTGSSFCGSHFGSGSNDTTSIPNPFYIGNLSSNDQDTLRSAFRNAF